MAGRIGRWKLSREEFAELCENYTIKRLANILGYSEAHIKEKKRQFGLSKKRG